MPDDRTKIKEFIAVLSKEIGEDINLTIKDEYAAISYSGLEVVISSGKNEFDYKERDLVDSLCRLRLLVIEKFNRGLPNELRHEAYKDLNGIKIESILDSKDVILITY